MLLDPRTMRLAARAARACRAFVAAAAAACGADAGSPAGPAPADTAPRSHVASRLPALRITTENGAAIASREVYVAATYTLTDTLGGTREGTTEIRGRGNSTWTLMPKKPYRLRLAASAPLLGMPASRHWALLANYADKTLLRNDMAFELSRQLGAAYTPRSEFAELYLNGAYQGIYQIADHIRVATDRVNVPELRATDTTATDVTGGYLLEIDELRGEDFCFDVATRPPTMTFCVKSPETLLEPAWARQRAYIEGYVRRLDSVIFSPDFASPSTGYAAYVDVASAVDYYLLNELFKNVDGNLRRSTFLHKPRGGKLTFGPVWDYDIAMGNVNYDGADLVEGWHVRRAAWYARLFQDPAFDARTRARWRQLRTDGTIDRLLSYLSARGRALGLVQARNFERWPILGTWVWPNRVVTGTYQGELFAMQDWLWMRTRWMDAQLGL